MKLLEKTCNGLELDTFKLKLGVELVLGKQIEIGLELGIGRKND
jgi:hypothetical protein